MKGDPKRLKWFAARTMTDRAYAIRYIEMAQAGTPALPQIDEHLILSDIPNLIFIRSTKTEVEKLMRALYDHLYFYRDPARRHPQAIPDGEMRTFHLLAPFHGKPVIYIPVDDPAIFKGPRYRVTEGEYKGCEGTLKRIKGEKRLIIKISDNAAVATPHIPAVLLEDIDNPICKAKIKSVFKRL